MFQLVLTKKDGKIISSLFEEQRLVQANVEKEEPSSLLGNVYIGKVKNIVQNINAAFVEIAGGEICYLSLLEKTKPIFVGRKKSGKIVIGDELLVQVSKDAIKTKNPSVTTKIQLAGRYTVLTQGDVRVGVSGKILGDEERLRLQNAVSQFVSEEYDCGIIVRTNAKNVENAVLRAEANGLFSTYKNIVEKGIYKTCFSLLYQAPRSFLCDIRDGYEDELEQIITDEQDIFEEIEAYMQSYQPEDIKKLSLYQDELLPLNRLYGIETKLEKALQERVWLGSGGYLVIQPTEALTVIDVNTGKAIANKKSREEHFLKINVEAAKEIARQLRLRNISGIVIVDFIDLSDKRSKEKLVHILQEEIKKDPIKTVFVEMTKLNLVEITRKKVRKPLWEQMKEQ